MPVIISAEKTISLDLAQSLQKLYESSPEFATSEEAVAKANHIVTVGGVVYVGWFNGKVVSAIMASGAGNQRLLHNIVVHPANRGRGIANRLMSETCRLEREHGTTQFVAGCSAIARLLRIDAARLQKTTN